MKETQEGCLSRPINDFFERSLFKKVALSGAKRLFRHAESPGASGGPVLEPVFTAEDAGWARDFFAGQGDLTQEYFVYFQSNQRGPAEKDVPGWRFDRF